MGFTGCVADKKPRESVPQAGDMIAAELRLAEMYYKAAEGNSDPAAPSKMHFREPAPIVLYASTEQKATQDSVEGGTTKKEGAETGKGATGGPVITPGPVPDEKEANPPPALKLPRYVPEGSMCKEGKNCDNKS